MRRITLALLFALVGLGGYLLGAARPAPSLLAQPAEQCFPETGKCIRGAFLTYWRANGALRQQGLPISDEFQETQAPPPAGDGKTYTVQYFERSRFELHPEFAGTPNEVLLGLLGSEQYRAKYPSGPPAGGPAQPAPVAPPPASGSPQVGVISQRSYRGVVGLNIVGEIENTGGDAGDVSVVASVLGGDGATLATGTDSMLLLVLGQGQRVGYRILIISPPEQFADIRLQVQASPATAIDRRFYYGDFVVEGVSIQPATSQFGGATLTGQIRNTGARAASGHVTAVAVGPDDRAVDVGEAFARLDPIPPGGSSPFEVRWGDQREAPANVRFTAWGSPK